MSRRQKYLGRKAELEEQLHLLDAQIKNDCEQLVDVADPLNRLDDLDPTKILAASTDLVNKVVRRKTIVKELDELKKALGS